MSSPIYNGLRKIIEKDDFRFHTPGHKGQLQEPFNQIAPWDLTEIEGTDSLYEADGIIRESEKQLALLYGCGSSLISAGGSTLCIQAMLALGCGNKGRLLAARGCHVSAVNAMALLDIIPTWLYPEINETTGLALGVSPAETDKVLKENPDISAMYITSPDYYGQNSDIAGIAKACKKHNVKLLVDCAHGAHYAFLPTSLDPIRQGADIACFSLHKTLPSLTGAAVLNLSEKFSHSDAKKAMSLFGSTSPSYLIMLSADMLIPYMKSGLKNDLCDTIKKAEEVGFLAADKGFKVIKGDPIRITLGFGALGYNQKDFAQLLDKCSIQPEYMDGYYCVFLPKLYDNDKDFASLKRAVNMAEKSSAIQQGTAALKPLEIACSIREATFALSEKIALEKAEGRVAGAMVAPCPPGIPIVMPGEIISGDNINTLKKYGISQMYVI